jgi:hypothetical protein
MKIIQVTLGIKRFRGAHSKKKQKNKTKQIK